jgi:2-hydroxymuconate-semialdehyde hydrolase
MSAEIGRTVDVGGIATNYHDEGDGPPVLLIHGSGPGVSAWANWRLTIPALAKRFRVVAPDILGFGYTERPDGVTYHPETWLGHLTGLLDALDLDRVSIVGNSFGGALALRLAVEQPHRLDRLVLMGSAGISFPITDGLDAVWGYQPSVEAMRALMGVFAYDRALLTEELACCGTRRPPDPACRRRTPACSRRRGRTASSCSRCLRSGSRRSTPRR